MTLVFVQLSVLFSMAIERHTDRERAREHLGIFDSGFVLKCIRTRASVALHDMHLVAVEISRCVKPGVRDVIDNINDKSLAFPMPPRIAHPELDVVKVFRTLHVNRAGSVDILISNRYEIGSLEDLERIGQIGNARHSW